MNELSLVIQIKSVEDAEKIRAVLREMGFTKTLLLNDSDDLLSLLYILREPGSEYKRMSKGGHLAKDSEFWNQIPDNVRVNLLAYLNYLWNKYKIPVDDYLIPPRLFEQVPPPPPGFMKGIVSVTEDFDAPLEDFKEYES